MARRPTLPRARRATGAMQVLRLHLNSRPMGRLTRASDGAVTFTYLADWLDWPAAIPLSMSVPLREEPYVGDAVLPVLDGLLPDEMAIRRRIAERVGARGADTFALLEAIGRDCVGALQFLPDDEEPGPAGAVAARRLSEADVAGVIRGLAQAPLGLGRNDAFRISLAGAQEKTALLRLKSGRFALPEGSTATTHILKPRIGRRADVDLSDSVENEHFCMGLAAAFGLPTAQTAIADFEDQHVLVVERFDRLWTRDGRLIRLPQEDFCQALGYPPSLKYEDAGGPGAPQLLDLLKAADDPAGDRLMLFKAMVVYWAMAATDCHGKNYSIRLRPQGRFAMTPLYDILSTQPYVDAGQMRRRQFKLALAFGDKRYYRVEQLRPRHLLQTAATAGLPPRAAQAVLDEVRDQAEAALAVAAEAMPRGFPAGLIESIGAGVRRRLALT